MDNDGYPTEDELSKIRNWDPSDFEGCMLFMKERWKWASAGFWEEEDGIYRISTGGWSGNEDLIDALQDNKVMWIFYWYSSRRGGHYEFRIVDHT